MIAPLAGTTTLNQTSPPEKLAQDGLIPESVAATLVPTVFTQFVPMVNGVAFAQSSFAG